MIYKKRSKRPKNLLYGKHPIAEALAAGKNLDKLYVQKGLQTDDVLRNILDTVKQRSIPTQKVPVEKLNRLTHNAVHQGVAGFAALIPYYTLEDVLSQAYEMGEVPLFILCEGVTDVGNLGAIARTAACTGVHALVLPERGSAAVNAEAIKASAGALHRLPVCKTKSADVAMSYLKNNGLQVLACDVHKDATMINRLDLSIPTLIVLGSEGEGLPARLVKKADHIAQIPIIGNFDSYNVSVAAGMVLYESMMQRKVKKK